MTQLKDRVFRTIAEKRGGHYHVTVFAADGPDHTFANLGTLVMDESDWLSFGSKFECEHRIKKPEPEPPPGKLPLVLYDDQGEVLFMHWLNKAAVQIDIPIRRLARLGKLFINDIEQPIGNLGKNQTLCPGDVVTLDVSMRMEKA